MLHTLWHCLQSHLWLACSSVCWLLKTALATVIQLYLGHCGDKASFPLSPHLSNLRYLVARGARYWTACHKTTFNTEKLFKVRAPSQTASMEQFPETVDNQISYRQLGDMWIPVCLCVSLPWNQDCVHLQAPTIHPWAPSHFLLSFPLSLISISSIC